MRSAAGAPKRLARLAIESYCPYWEDLGLDTAPANRSSPLRSALSGSASDTLPLAGAAPNHVQWVLEPAATADGAESAPTASRHATVASAMRI